MYNNLWQILMFIQKQKEEEERRRMEAAMQMRSGANDSGMSLQQMFQQFRPTLSNAMQGNIQSRPIQPQQPPLGGML